LGSKPLFARNNFLAKRLVKSRCYKCKISNTLLAATIAVEQEVTVNAIKIPLFIFTRFWHAPAHVQSKPSSKFALRHRLLK